MLRGLSPSTVYSVKAKAIHGDFTESGYGPVSSAATVDPYLTFDIDTAPTDTVTNPPYEINFGDLVAGSVNTATNKLWVSLATNANNGALIYNDGKNAGLKSDAASYTIPSVTGDMASQTEGFGEQGDSATQTSGGPLTLTAPYDGTADNVGAIYASFQELMSTTTPVAGGRGSLLLKAKSQLLTPASSDYTELLTVVAAGSF
jgi:hypothetical protein